MLTSFFEHADFVVDAVVGLLLAASVASWAIILEKLVTLGHLRRAVAGIEEFARDPRGAPAQAPVLLTTMLAARADEALDEDGPASLRARREAAMRGAYLADVRARERGLSYLATLASTAPFIGLFGTVWGIMQSFSSIAAANDTSLAVVAPGIAGALFATAIGLGAAIPAVVAYNLIRAALTRCSQRLAAAAATLAKAAPPGARAPLG